uniref:Uncharacterized protein LOC111107086 n=1 Tax=Crassostrea virginica TaxID=6565 RepID=A0A8B8B3X9_CRAVI|nr:uncharacterized protein LOC111107086 [Crassostrea virginica]
MSAYLTVLLLFSFFEFAKSKSSECISREEFEKFKTEVLTRIESLSLEKYEQAKQIEDQKTAILHLGSLLEKYGDTSLTSSNIQESTTKLTEKVPVEPANSMKDSSIPLPLRTETPLKRLLPTGIRVPEDVIAFYAYLTTSEINPGAHHFVVYDHVVTNSGNGYSKHTGAFVAPRTGFYVFSWTTFVDPHSYFPMELTLNSVRAGIVYVQGDTTYNGVTGVAVIQLQQNDVVMVRSEPGFTPKGNIYSDPNTKTSFSGWCISC